jgi:hypothetical protein
MPLYEVELRGEQIEDRLTDHSLEVGTSLTIGGRRYLVAQAVAARDMSRALRYICVETGDDSRALRGQSEALKARSRELAGGDEIPPARSS